MTPVRTLREVAQLETDAYTMLVAAFAEGDTSTARDCAEIVSMCRLIRLSGQPARTADYAQSTRDPTLYDVDEMVQDREELWADDHDEELHRRVRRLDRD
jgi:hypothetical protein